MSDLKEFRLPDVGEGLTEGEVLVWHVAVGDTVMVNQIVVEVETAKAAVELPIPWAGVVTELQVPVGVTIAVGTPLLTIDCAAPGADSFEETVGARPEADLVPSGAPPPARREAVLVGYGVREAAVTRRPRSRRPGGATGPAGSTAGVTSSVGSVPTSRARTSAKPPVRKLAKDLGVDLAGVNPSGPDGTITREDVLARAPVVDAAPSGLDVASTALVGELVPAASVDGERREPVRGIRKYMAEAMVRSAFTIPHVTVWAEVDVTRTVRMTRRLRETPGFNDVRVSPLLLVARGVLLSLKRNPDLNAVFDAEAQEVVYRDRVNLGFAAATPRGLVVPNIKAADQLSLPELAAALDLLVRTAREGHTAPADMAHGTFTITNVGVFGVDGGTPIINPGEAGILAVGAFREKAWVHKGRVKPRWVAELTVSFDHRHIDGSMGSRFLADVASVLEDPAVAVSWA